MIENQMTNYREPRMSYAMYQEVQLQYRQRREIPKTPKGCITAPSKSEGSRFHAQA